MRESFWRNGVSEDETATFCDRIAANARTRKRAILLGDRMWRPKRSAHAQPPRLSYSSGFIGSSEERIAPAGAALVAGNRGIGAGSS